MTIGIIFVVLSLVLLIFLAYKGISVMVVAPLMALLAYAGSTVFIGGSGHFFATYTEVFMKGAGTFIINNFPVFLLGAIYGKFLDRQMQSQILSQVNLDRNMQSLQVLLQELFLHMVVFHYLLSHLRCIQSVQNSIKKPDLIRDWFLLQLH